MKKAAALLIVVLFIAIFGAVMVTATRAGLLNGIFTNNTIDAMIAEEASQAGLEAGLLYFKNNSAQAVDLCVNLELSEVKENQPTCQFSALTRYAKVSVALVPNNPSLISITSIGHYGYVVKKHTLTQKAVLWQ